MDIKVRGIENITKISPDNNHKKIKYNEDGSFSEINEKILNTLGTNFSEIIKNELIDYTRTISNNISEIYDILGIEAARCAIIAEISNVFKDENISDRHFELLVDSMTYKGAIFSVNRHSIKKNDDYGPLAKASFEEPLDRLVHSSANSIIDTLKWCIIKYCFRASW